MHINKIKKNYIKHTTMKKMIKQLLNKFRTNYEQIKNKSEYKQNNKEKIRN